MLAGVELSSSAAVLTPSNAADSRSAPTGDALVAPNETARYSLHTHDSLVFRADRQHRTTPERMHITVATNTTRFVATLSLGCSPFAVVGDGGDDAAGVDAPGRHTLDTFLHAAAHTAHDLVAQSGFAD